MQDSDDADNSDENNGGLKLEKKDEVLNAVVDDDHKVLACMKPSHKKRRGRGEHRSSTYDEDSSRSSSNSPSSRQKLSYDIGAIVRAVTQELRSLEKARLHKRSIAKSDSKRKQAKSNDLPPAYNPSIVQPDLLLAPAAALVMPVIDDASQVADIVANISPSLAPTPSNAAPVLHSCLPFAVGANNEKDDETSMKESSSESDENSELENDAMSSDHEIDDFNDDVNFVLRRKPIPNNQKNNNCKACNELFGRSLEHKGSEKLYQNKEQPVIVKHHVLCACTKDKCLPNHWFENFKFVGCRKEAINALSMGRDHLVNVYHNDFLHIEIPNFGKTHLLQTKSSVCRVNVTTTRFSNADFKRAQKVRNRLYEFEPLRMGANPLEFGHTVHEEFKRLYIQDYGDSSNYELRFKHFQKANQQKDINVYFIDSMNVISRGVIKQWHADQHNGKMKFLQLEKPDGSIFNGVRIFNQHSSLWEIIRVDSNTGAFNLLTNSCSAQTLLRQVYKDLKSRLGVCVEIQSIVEPGDLVMSVDELYPIFVKDACRIKIDFDVNVPLSIVRELKASIPKAVLQRQQVVICDNYCVSLRGYTPHVLYISNNAKLDFKWETSPLRIEVPLVANDDIKVEEKFTLAMTKLDSIDDSKRKLWAKKICSDFHFNDVHLLPFVPSFNKLWAKKLCDDLQRKHAYNTSILQEIPGPNNALATISTGQRQSMNPLDVVSFFCNTLEDVQKPNINSIKLYYVSNSCLHNAFEENCKSMLKHYQNLNIKDVDWIPTLAFFGVQNSTMATWTDIASQGVKAAHGNCTLFASDGILVSEESGPIVSALPLSLIRSVVVCIIFRGRVRTGTMNARFSANDESFSLSENSRTLYYVKEHLVTPVYIITF